MIIDVKPILNGETDAMAFDIDYTVCVIVMAVITAVYVIVGGYMATAVNDFVQGMIMIVGIIAVIAAVLKDNGELYWHWNLLWDREETPEQDMWIDLIGNLSEWRRELGNDFLVAGRMEKSPKVECGSNTVYLKQNRTENVATIESACWSNLKGEKVLFLANYSSKELSCSCDVKGTVVKRNGEEFKFNGGEVTVPKLDAIMIKLEK